MTRQLFICSNIIKLSLENKLTQNDNVLKIHIMVLYFYVVINLVATNNEYKSKFILRKSERNYEFKMEGFYFIFSDTESGVHIFH